MSKNLNDIAQERFNELKTKMKLHLQKPYVEEIKRVSEDKINRMLNEPVGTNIHSFQVEDAEEPLRQARINSASVDATFNFIDSLNLPSELSLAIGLIISGHRTQNAEDIKNAIKNLEGFLTC